MASYEYGPDITSRESIERYKIGKVNIKNKKLAKVFTEAIAESKRIESEVIAERSHVCTTEDIEYYQKSMENVDLKELRKLSSNKFQNPSIISAIACTSSAIFYIDQSKGDSSQRSYAVRKYLKGAKAISSGAQGHAVRGMVGGVESMFIVKMPVDPDDPDDLSHEYFVGLTCTNILRYRIPNFAYVFGVAKCSPPVVDSETKEVYQICSSDGKKTVPYVIYENISPSLQLSKYAEKSSVSEYMSIYFQCVLAVAMGYNYFKFTHYDLHDANVLVRKVGNNEKPFQIHYKIGRNSYYVTTTRVAVIIDYGYAHVEYEGKPHGIKTEDFVPLSISPNISWPHHDFHKLICFMLRKSLQLKDKAKIAEIEKVIRFYNKSDSLETIVQEQWRTRYGLPRIGEAVRFSPADFIRYLFLFDEWRNIISTERDPTIPLLTCEGLADHFVRCEDDVEIEQAINLRPGAMSFEEIYALRPKELKYDYRSKTYVQQKKKIVEEYVKCLNELNMKLRMLKNVNLQGMDILSKTTCLLVRTNNILIFRITEVIDELVDKLTIIRYVVGRYGDRSMKTWISGNIESLDEIKSEMAKSVEKAVYNYEKIYEVMFDGKLQEFKKEFLDKKKKIPELNWYAKSADNILSIEKRYKNLNIEKATRYNPEDLTFKESKEDQVSSEVRDSSLLTMSPVRGLFK